MKKLFLFIIAACLSLHIQAQKTAKYSEEEFRAKQQAYMTAQASLTKQEAAKFFPLYFELQDRKKKMNRSAWDYAKQHEGQNATESDFEHIVDSFMDLQVEATRLDQEYLKKYKDILSSQKIYLLYKAEIKFHRNMIKIIQQKDDKK